MTKQVIKIRKRTVNADTKEWSAEVAVIGATAHPSERAAVRNLRISVRRVQPDGYKYGRLTYVWSHRVEEFNGDKVHQWWSRRQDSVRKVVLSALDKEDFDNYLASRG